MTNEQIKKTVLLLLAAGISILFLVMIRQFLMVILLAGIFTALAYPVYRRLQGWMGGRRQLAALLTLLLIVVVIVVPMGILFGIVTAQAIKVGKAVTPWVQHQMAHPTAFSDLLSAVPFYEDLMPYQATLLKKAGEMVSLLSNFLVDSLGSATLTTIQFLFMLFLMLYAMFFFFMDGKSLLEKILYYLPLEDTDERRLVERFTSVTRSALKGTVVIGLIQGSLGGIAFSVVGIQSAVFWGAIMTVLSVIPGIGAALVWGPAVLVLAAGGHWIKALALAVFCAVVIGSVDNLLRPVLMGRDTQLHELLILFSTLGGIVMFGMVGFIIGPVIAALFVTIWDIYGNAFSDVLPDVKMFASGADDDDD